MRYETLNIYSESEVIQLLMSGYSLSRFGDGEFNIAMGNKRGIEEFQTYTEGLALALKNVLGQDLNSEENANFLIGIPQFLSTYKNSFWKQKQFWSTYNVSKRRWVVRHLYHEGHMQRYGDTFFARVTGLYAQTPREFADRVSRLKQVWEDKDVLIIEERTTRLGVGSDLLTSARSINRFLIPSKNAFDQYRNIINDITRLRKPDLVLVVAGPTATVLVYDLYLLGYQAIDLGQINGSYMVGVEQLGVRMDHILTESEYRNQIVNW